MRAAAERCTARRQPTCPRPFCALCFQCDPCLLRRIGLTQYLQVLPRMLQVMLGKKMTCLFTSEGAAICLDAGSPCVSFRFAPSAFSVTHAFCGELD